MPPNRGRTRDDEEEKQWIPMLERGCCCSLEVCCKVQASLVVMASMMYAPLVLVEYFRCQQLEKEGLPPIRTPDCKYDERAPHPAQARVAEVVVKILLQTISLLAALAFLVGIKRRRPKLLLPYVRVLAVQMVLSAFGLLIKAAVYNMWVEAIIFFLPLGVGLPYYMWLCAYSLYRKMKREHASRPAPHYDGEHALPALPALPPTVASARVFVPPPGFVLPPGYGYGAPAPVEAIPIPVLPPGLPHGLPPGLHVHVGYPADGAFMKPEDVPPPPYEAVVGAGLADQAAAAHGSGKPPTEADGDPQPKP